MKLTLLQLKEEWDYRYQERLGLLCEDRVPTKQEEEMARREANKAIERIVSLEPS